MDNRLVQIGLVFLAFYVILQIMNKDTSQEHLDSSVQDFPSVSIQQDPFSQAQVSVTQQPPNETVVNVSMPTGSSALTSGVPSTLAGATVSQASANPVSTSTPSSALTNVSALTSVDETLLAAAPPRLPGDEVKTVNQNIFAPAPSDLDAMFGRRGNLDPTDLIPKVQDAELYAGIKPDPKLNQNFLQNRWSLGIMTDKNSYNMVNDLRGAPPPPPMSITGVFNQPVKFPDLYRRSLADIS
jgi:hypothetical protein